MNVIVAAPGESLTEDLRIKIFGHFALREYFGTPYVIAVCDAYKRVFCDAIVANDAAWWRERPDACAMNVGKFTTRKFPGVEQIQANELVSGGSSSGVLALWVARKLGAKRIMMVGFDHKGTHFFGPHVGRLKNTPPSRWPIFTAQFKQMAYQLAADKIDVLNCTPGTALDVFPTAKIDEGLGWLTQLKAA